MMDANLINATLFVAVIIFAIRVGKFEKHLIATENRVKELEKKIGKKTPEPDKEMTSNG